MARLTAAQTAAVFGMTPSAAVAYLEQKGLRLTGDWHEMLNEEHMAAFTVANVAQLDVLQDLQQGILRAAKTGTTERQFIKDLTPILQAKGWWGKQTNPDGSATQLGSVRRLQTIYRTNLQSAYMAGRYHALVQGVKSHPYWQYVAVMDEKTRPSHAAANGRVFRWDDPVWLFLFPPNGFNCRCRVVALSEADVERRGLKVESSEGLIVRKEVQAGIDADGKPVMTDVSGIKLPTTDGKFVTLFTDAGFDVNQGLAATEHAARIFANKAERADPDLGASAMTAARTWLMPQIAAEFRVWAADVIAGGVARNGYRVIGSMTPEVLAGVRAVGIEPATAALTLRDAELLHLLRDSKAVRGAALPRADVLRLPELLADPVAVLWDQADPALVYVFDAADGAGKAIVRVNYDLKLNDGGRAVVQANSIRSAGMAELGDLENAARYRRLAGVLHE
ncbi:MAG: phage minor head protein [Burkholderiaceae bacterium]